MAGEYGIERGVLLPPLPEMPAGPLKDYLRRSREAVAAAYDELAKRLNELSYEVHWGSETPAVIGSDKNDYQLGDAVVHRLEADNAWTISGFVAPLTEQMHVLINVGAANNITIAHQSGGSADENKVITVSGLNVAIAPADSMMIWYDLTTARWRELLP